MATKRSKRTSDELTLPLLPGLVGVGELEAARAPTATPKAPSLPRYSPTKLALYRFCPRAYAFTYDRKLRLGTSSPGQSFGSSLHRALQLFHNDGGPEKVSIERLRAKYHEGFSEAGYASVEEAAQYRAEGERLLDRYYEEAREAGRVTIATERTLQHGYEKFVLFGRVDRIDRRPDGGLEVIDYKSGRLTTSEDEVRGSLAMAVYQLLLSRENPGVDVYTKIICLRTGDSAAVLRSREELSLVELEVIELVQQIEADSTKKAAPGEACRRCDFSRVCRAGGHWLRLHPSTE